MSKYRFPRKVKKAKKKCYDRLLAWMRRQEKSVHGPDVFNEHVYMSPAWERGMSGSYDVRSGNTGNEKG
jgi:hypothetical protein